MYSLRLDKFLLHSLKKDKDFFRNIGKFTEWTKGLGYSNQNLSNRLKNLGLTPSFSSKKR